MAETNGHDRIGSQGGRRAIKSLRNTRGIAKRMEGHIKDREKVEKE